MIDIHSHLIFGVDDGSPSIKESIRMVLEAERLGVKAIIATPHFHENIYNTEQVAQNFHELVSRVSNCDISLYLGCEVFMTASTPEIVRQNKGLRMDGSSYILLELPFDVIPAYSYDVIYKLHLDNITPIIAHPERNRNCVNNFNAFMGLVEKGCLLQLDAASIIGVYGSEIKNFTKRLIKLNLVHFVASDAHSMEDYINWYLEARKQVARWAGEEYTDKLFNKNSKIILDKIIE